MSELQIAQILYLAFSIFICTFPANCFIQWFMKKNGIFVDDKNNGDLLQAGRIIGILERILFLIFIVNNHYNAVGFLIAAKSILRFKDAEAAKTQYLLIGSLLSLLIAVVFGIGYTKLKIIL